MLELTVLLNPLFLEAKCEKVKFIEQKSNKGIDYGQHVGQNCRKRLIVNYSLHVHWEPYFHGQLKSTQGKCEGKSWSSQEERDEIDKSS